MHNKPYICHLYFDAAYGNMVYNIYSKPYYHIYSSEYAPKYSNSEYYLIKKFEMN